ncbi:hypothetical protein ACFVZC_07280 [Streptomyces marokkonensis]|uniref:Uncharacterized protein n=1 Tax=Streptomyces marokkonensis TaxID=324855 RepID=A0ABW6Q235_9ACTN
MHVAPAPLTEDPDPAPLPEAVEHVLVDGRAVEVVWAGGRARTRITFEPVEVRHTER